MSRRHQQSRRRSYGRRQHELHERRERREPFAVEEREPALLLDLDAAAGRLGRLTFARPAAGWAEGAA